MNHSAHEELFTVLDEILRLRPEFRFGQLIANLATLARGPEIESIWDVEDNELVAAAKKQLESFKVHQEAAT